MMIDASKDTYNSSTVSKTWEENLTLASSNSGGAGAAIDNMVNALQLSLGLAMSRSKSDISSVTYNNSALTASLGNIKINSLGVSSSGEQLGGDLTISGANLLAKDVTLNTQGNLTIESLQDSYKEKGSSFGVSLGGGGGKFSGSGSVNFGVNYSSNKTDKLWTNNQTSIIGTNSITINTANNTDIKGAMIANITNATLSSLRGGEADVAIQKDWIDGNKLTLNTKTLTFANLYDHEYSQNTGFGFSTNIGLGKSSSASNNITNQGTASANNPNQQNNYYPNGSTTISAQNSGYKKEQTTKATIGNGDITANSILTFDTNGDLLTNTGGTLLAETDSTLTNLNRDITNSQEITKDTIINALNASVTVDNRIITAAAGNQAALNSLLNEQKNLGSNLAVTTEGQIEIAKKIWASPNTAIGLTYGAAGYLYGAATGQEVKVSVGNNAVQFEGNPLGQNGAALTLGNSINYFGSANVESGKTFDESKEYYTYQATQNYIKSNGNYRFIDSDKILLAPHEREHTYQSEILGPLFLPTYFLSGGISTKNWLENEADKVGNSSYINWKYNENK